MKKFVRLLLLCSQVACVDAMEQPPVARDITGTECALVVYTDAMEQPSVKNDKNIAEYDYCGVSIVLKKGPISDLSGTVDCMIVGLNEQEMLQNFTSIDNMRVGGMKIIKDKILYVRNAADESNSDDDTYKPFDSRTLCENSHPITMDNMLIAVREPRLTYDSNNPHKNYIYKVDKIYYEELDKISHETYYDKSAIKHAREDLNNCYKKVLSLIVKNNPIESKKNIAFSALSTEVGLPRVKAAPVAVNVIIGFIKKNPSVCSCIYFCVPKRFEFKLYQELLKLYCTEK